MSKLPQHLFSSSDGALYDTRALDWSKSNPLRRDFCQTHSRINTTAEFKATLRAGAFAWPGGYPLFLITSDCAAICFACARKERRNIFDSISNKSNDGWRVVATDINYEDSELTCDHCSKRIESAYGED